MLVEIGLEVGDRVRLFDETATHEIVRIVTSEDESTVYYCLENGRGYAGGGLVLVERFDAEVEDYEELLRDS